MTNYALEVREYISPATAALFTAVGITSIIAGILMIVGLVITILSVRMIIRSVVGMIVSITGSMEGLAKGDTDLEIPGREREDEIGAMARALGVFKANAQSLREMTENELAQQQLVSQKMRDLRSENSQFLDGMADRFEISVGKLITSVSAASSQLRTTSHRMVELADDSNEQAEIATESMETANINLTAAAAAIDQLSLSISEISRQASASAGLARHASDQVKIANTRMSDLSQAGLEVGEIVELIQTIAKRTNLLALNASIEASRGGEAGKGFAVVASEVKELASQTGDAANSVTERIAIMQKSTQLSAGDLDSIVQQIGELEQAAVTIASAVDEQSVSGEELTRSIDTVVSGSTRVGETLESLRSSSAFTKAAANDVVTSASAMGTDADDLRTQAMQFIADVRRSAKDLKIDENELEQQLG